MNIWIVKDYNHTFTKTLAIIQLYRVFNANIHASEPTIYRVFNCSNHRRSGLQFLRGESNQDWRHADVATEMDDVIGGIRRRKRKAGHQSITVIFCGWFLAAKYVSVRLYPRTDCYLLHIAWVRFTENHGSKIIHEYNWYFRDS